jgi:branched-chain amino acid transport system permease protein
MTPDIALLLAQDGITNGAIYALLALALVLAFAVTRVIFIPQGEFVAYGALTLVALQTGRLPGTVWLLLVAGGLVSLIEIARALRAAAGAAQRVLEPALPARTVGAPRPRPTAIAADGGAGRCAGCCRSAGSDDHRLAYQPLAEASVLILLIVSVAVHVVMVGLGLLVFGAEGARTPPFSKDGRARHAEHQCPVALDHRLLGRSDRAALPGIRAHDLRQGAACHGGEPPRRETHGHSDRVRRPPLLFLCALIGALSGILIAPITTIYYDTGFNIGLKGFVGAIIGGLASYPIAALGALLVGLLESYASFLASAYKEVIVFTLIIPVLLVRSLRAHHIEEDE